VHYCMPPVCLVRFPFDNFTNVKKKKIKPYKLKLKVYQYLYKVEYPPTYLYLLNLLMKLDAYLILCTERSSNDFHQSNHTSL